MSGEGIHDEDALNIYTDGSSFPHKQRAAGVGVLFVWVDVNGNEVVEEYSPPGWQSATSDEMEIKAISTALKEIPNILHDLGNFSRILVFCDSQYVVNNFTNAMYVWPTKGWKKTNGLPAANISLWKELRKEVTRAPIKVDIEWVKAHKSNLFNRKADSLARKSSELPFNKPISLGATTRKWSPNSTKRGCVSVSAQAIKIRIVSRKMIKKPLLQEYRYEVICPEDPHFQELDFVYYDGNLSRAHCYEVRLNADQNKPTIVEVIRELEAADYKVFQQ